MMFPTKHYFFHILAYYVCINAKDSLRYTGVKHGVWSITPPENIIKFNALHSTRRARHKLANVQQLFYLCLF